MFEVIIYTSENGKSSVKDFFDSLHADKSKSKERFMNEKEKFKCD